jgi:hypothetical protein
MQNIKSYWLQCGILFLIYISSLFYFNAIDIYHQQFFASGATVIVYNTARVSIIFAIIWLFYAAGDGLLRLIVPDSYPKTCSLTIFSLGFFAGVGVWHSALFILGLAGLYNRTLLDVMTASVCLLSLPRLADWLQHGATQRKNIYWLGVLLILLPITLFVMIKGLYPAGGHDYFNHYFQYYRSVTENSSLAPNPVWYHFYYSKGDALFFLAMLLTDPLGPQLATTAMIFAGAGLVFLILNHKSSWRMLPWLGVALYFLFQIYTPGPVENMHQGGWGDLEKCHEPAAVLMLAMVWLVLSLIRHELAAVYGCTLVLTVIALVLISPVMAVFATAFLIPVFCYFLNTKQKTSALWLFISMAVAGILLPSLWLTNYMLTGIPDDQSLFLVWPLINFQKVMAWGVTFEVLVLHWTKALLVGQQQTLTSDFIFRMMSYVRLDVWWPLFMVSVSLFTTALCLRTQRQRTLSHSDMPAILVCTTLLISISVLALFIGRDQPVSFYRFTTFAYAPMLCLCLLLFSATSRTKWMRVTALVLVLMTVGLVTAKNQINASWDNQRQILLGSYRVKNIAAVLKNGANFAVGKYSLADAYKNQQGWPGRMAWGGIYPAAETVWTLLPRGTRIWSMHVHSYCMLPDCDMEGYISFRFSPHAANIYYGKPAEAKRILQSENLNYFFFSNALELTDPLPLSPLFSPQHIAEYLGIVWTDGNNTLLTWKDQALYPIDSAWLTHYNQRVIESPTVQHFPYDAMKTAMDILREKGELKQSDLPWSTSIKG